MKLPEEQLKEILQFTLWRMESLPNWCRDSIYEALKLLALQMKINFKDFLAPVFIAVSGTASSFSVMDAMELLGSDMSRARLRYALHQLYGETGKKQLKKLEKKYQTLPY